jgi:hypothetical protein
MFSRMIKKLFQELKRIKRRAATLDQHFRCQESNISYRSYERLMKIYIHYTIEEFITI